MRVSGFLKNGISAPGVIVTKGRRYTGELADGVVKLTVTYRGQEKTILLAPSEFKALEEAPAQAAASAKAAPKSSKVAA